MVFKTFQNSDISHIRYPITKRKTIVTYPEDQYNYFVTQIDNPSVYNIAGLQRYIYNNFTFIKYSQNQKILETLQGNCFPTSMFYLDNNKIFIISNSINTIIFIKNIHSINPQKLISLNLKISDVEYVELPINDYIIYQDQNYESPIGVFIPNINAILLKNSYEGNKWQIEIQYDFEIHEFEYICNIEPEEFNRTLNITAYEKDLNSQQFKLIPNIDHTYITSIGLYDDKNILMAIAKLSSPIKISNIIDTTIIVQLDYIP